jgi:sterol desaturase/sphingolipid hydroxylase (fatty acid hydroxylase superfamily)
VFAFVIGTFFDYMVHRFLLHGPLWRLHENHHLPSVVSNVMPGIAARPFVIVPNFLINAGSCAAIFLTVRLIGNSRLITAFIYVVPALLLTFTFVACASHSIFLRRFHWVETLFRALLLIGPREHIVHHSAEIQGNYGNFTSLWDHAFGTYVSPREMNDHRLGLAYDQDFLGAITAGRFKLPHPIRSRFQVGLVCRIDETRPGME